MKVFLNFVAGVSAVSTVLLSSSIVAQAESESVPSVRQEGAETRVVYLKSVRAIDLEGTLKELLRAAPKSAGQRPVVVAHAPTNSLLVSGSDEQLGKLLALISALDRPATAKSPSSEASVDLDEDQLSLSVGEAGLEIADFVQLAQSITGEVYQLRGDSSGDRVKFVGTVRVPKDEFGEFFQTMLFTQGYQVRADRKSGVWIVEPADRLAEDSTAAFVSVEDLGNLEFPAGVSVTTFVTLDYLNAHQASKSVRPFIADPARLVAAPASDGYSLVIRGPIDAVRDVVHLLQLLDREPVERRQTKVIVLENESADGVVNALLTLLSQSHPSAAGPVFRALAHGDKKVLISGHPSVVSQALDLTAKLDTPR